MNTIENQPQKIILDLQKLNELNSMGYAGKFCLGDTVVVACGDWNGGPKYIHEHEAVYDKMTNTYWDRRCYEARKKQSP
ncbi:MAG: hypothetical protein R6X10_16100 [Desulfobacterales bacterium]